jgi:hypothetical protein
MKTLVCAILVAGSAAIVGGQDAEKKKPSLTLRASPSAGFTPLKVVLTAELKGGDDDFADYYCPTVEWVWGDDTRAESTADCEPYEPGKSKIQRRYTTSRVFQIPGDLRVEFRLKQKDKVVGANSTRITVRPGVRDGGGDR